MADKKQEIQEQVDVTKTIVMPLYRISESCGSSMKVNQSESDESIVVRFDETDMNEQEKDMIIHPTVCNEYVSEENTTFESKQEEHQKVEKLTLEEKRKPKTTKTIEEKRKEQRKDALTLEEKRKKQFENKMTLEEKRALQAKGIHQTPEKQPRFHFHFRIKKQRKNNS